MTHRNLRAGDSSGRRGTAFAMAMLAAVAFAAPAAAEPPPWAPAHGYRAKKGAPVYVVRLPPVLQDGRCQTSLLDKETAGGLIGAAAGGPIGAQIGSGRGQLAATAIGVLVGAVLGREVGASLDRADELCIAQTFEHAPSGQAIVWSGPKIRYRVVPLDAFQIAGEHCRQYTAQGTIDGKARQVNGTACRQADGVWKLIN